MKRVFLAMLTVCLTLWGCQQDNISDVEQPQEVGNRISFSTKGAVVATENIEDMSMLCYETGTAKYSETTSLPNHMFWAKAQRNNVDGVYYDWTVEESSISGAGNVDKYWSQGNYHSFVAFAPFNVSLYYYTPNESTDAGLPTFTYNIPDKMADHKDLTYALTLNQLDNFADNDPAKRSVGLYFKHALSKIMFTAQLATGVNLPSGEKFRIAGIAINGIKQSGKFSFKKAETTTETVIGGESSSADYIDWDLTGVSDVSPVYSETELTYLNDNFITWESPATDKINIIAGENALFMMPQTFNTSRTLRISYVHHTTAVPDGILKEYEITLPQNAWEAGKSITYNLKFNPSSGSSPWEADAIIEDWADNSTSVSASEAYFTLTDGKRHYGWSEAEGTSTSKRTFTIPFETNVPLADITVSASGTVVKSDINRTIIYTESDIEANDRDEITVTMKLRDGEGDAAQTVTRNMTIRIGGYEIIEQDTEYGIAIEKRNYYYSRYSDKSHMYNSTYDMPSEAIKNDPTWTKSTGGYEVDFRFEIYQVNEGQGDIATANPILTLPDGIEIIDGMNTSEKIYNTADNWNDSFGEKLLRLRVTSEMIGTATLNIGTAEEHRLSFSVLDGAIVTDYTNQEFVSNLTGLPTTYGGVNGLRVANCYITSPHTDYATIFYIPIKDRVNEFWREYSGLDEAAAEEYTIPDESWIYDDDYSVELSWYDGTNSGTSPKITELQVAKNYSPSTNDVSAQNAIIVVQPKGFEEQNYAINIKKNGTIIWSIHCWATKYNPYRNTLYTTAPERTTINEVVSVVGGDLHSYADDSDLQTPAVWGAGGIYVEKLIMDRSLGALSLSYDGHGASGTLKGGLYYQFGRKDPILSSGIKNNGTQVSSALSGKYTFIESVNNPTTFMRTPDSSKYWYNWNTDTDSASTCDWQWNDEKMDNDNPALNPKGKSIFDPSPLGFRVPIIEVWQNFVVGSSLSISGSPQIAKYELKSGYAYIYAVGFIRESTLAVTYPGTFISYRSTNPATDSSETDYIGRAYYMQIQNSVIGRLHLSGKYYAMNVRPIQE